MLAEDFLKKDINCELVWEPLVSIFHHGESINTFTAINHLASEINRWDVRTEATLAVKDVVIITPSLGLIYGFTGSLFEVTSSVSFNKIYTCIYLLHSPSRAPVTHDLSFLWANCEARFCCGTTLGQDLKF